MSRVEQFVRKANAIVRPTSATSRFVTYYELLEAFTKPGCPVCARLEQGSLKAMDGLLYEQVTDPTTRARLVESRGFCNWHAWMSPRIQNSPLGVAVIYHHLLAGARERLAVTRAELGMPSWWRRLWRRVTRKGDRPLALVGWWRDRARCPTCAMVGRSEREHLKAMLTFLSEAEFADGFARSAGLCLPHLCHAATIGRDHPNLLALLSGHEARWSELLAELGEFTRKNDYRFATEAMGHEGDSWRRALEVFVGRGGVFGSDRKDGSAGPAGVAQSETTPIERD
ncbi:MAG: hypothetical protein A2Z31_02570 [candidate division NC10 bacterium RBG_16_65_8]|nr:MAG: hypothetical protein A2Z31_02570 [candidate division NC10 bacterium RBG_16_65_8]